MSIYEIIFTALNTLRMMQDEEKILDYFIAHNEPDSKMALITSTSGTNAVSLDTGSKLNIYKKFRRRQTFLAP